MHDITPDSTSSSSDDLSSSPESQQTSTGTPGCQHEWMCLQMSHGVILGVDSTGAPVFIEDLEDLRSGTAYGCVKCDEPWSPDLLATPAC